MDDSGQAGFRRTHFPGPPSSQAAIGQNTAHALPCSGPQPPFPVFEQRRDIRVRQAAMGSFSLPVGKTTVKAAPGAYPERPGAIHQQRLDRAIVEILAWQSDVHETQSPFPGCRRALWIEMVKPGASADPESACRVRCQGLDRAPERTGRAKDCEAGIRICRPKAGNAPTGRNEVVAGW